MNERPIILNHDAVRLFTQGIKTHYRCPVQKTMTLRSADDAKYFLDGVLDSFGQYFRYPFGPPGDRVWVRESFRPEALVYKSDGDHTAPRYGIGGWLPPVYMPRWASRLMMELKSVYIEPLMDISERDAALEGSDLFEFPTYWNRKYKKDENQWGSQIYVWVNVFEVI